MEKTTSFPNFIWHYTCVPGEIGIRGSKDLRAGLRKYLRPTNERKQMSTKTLRKRIALVAVSALTAGVVSVVAVPSANAATFTSTKIAGTNIYPNTAAGAAASLADGAGGQSSQGLIATNGASSPNALAQTATMFANGTLAVSTTITSVTGATAKPAQRITVSGGVLATVLNSGTNGGAVTLNATQTSAVTAVTAATAGDGNHLGALIRPNAGVTTFTVTGFNDATAGNEASWAITVTIAAASVAGVPSVADSTVTFSGTDGLDSAVDVAGANAANPRTPLFLNVQLNDAYGTNISATTGALVATATAGAIVGFSAGTGAVGAISATTHSATAVSTASPEDLNIRVQEATAGSGWNGTVTVTYNGVVIATKSGSIKGDVAKLTITVDKIGKNDGNATADALRYQATDAAGNIVVVTAATVTLNTSSAPGIISAAVGTNDNSSTAAGKGTITCVATAAGKSSITMQVVTAGGVVVKSAPVEFSCAGQGVAYRASWDKASYAQGDIATLTVQFLDSRGNAANSSDAVGATTNQVITATQMERVTPYATTAVPDAKGQNVYTYTVGTSSGVVAGSYNAIVSYPTVNALAGENQTAKYTVTAGSAVSNADVLKSIVALIASINKQIQALQKLILRR
jgi:hypothetical protein